jgi:hypothetical protein
MKFKEGDVYYEVTFPDIAMCYPNVRTYVFVGETAEDGKRIFCFQYAERFARLGSIFEAKPNDRYAFLKTEEELAEMRDLKSLIAALKASDARRAHKARRRGTGRS